MQLDSSNNTPFNFVTVIFNCLATNYFCLSLTDQISDFFWGEDSQSDTNNNTNPINSTDLRNTPHTINYSLFTDTTTSQNSKKSSEDEKQSDNSDTQTLT